MYICMYKICLHIDILYAWMKITDEKMVAIKFLPQTENLIVDDSNV